MDSDASPAAEDHPAKRARITLSEHHDWAMVDGFLRPPRGDDLNCASKGESLVVGFRAVAPPKTSHIFFTLHPANKEGPSSSPHYSEVLASDAKAVAAHRDAVLLRFVIRGDPAAHSTDDCSDDDEEFSPSRSTDDASDDEGFLPSIREEFIVYKASPLSLISLPTCGHSFVNTRANNMGILCRNDEEFVVAHLRVTPKRHDDAGRSECLVTAELCSRLGKDKDGPWRTVKDVPIRCAEGKGEELCWWETDAVVPFGQYLCWVDYLRGILFCDVFSPCPELKYVPLPVDPYKGRINRHFGGRGPLSAFRSVCVTGDGGALKFVDVASSRCWFYGRPPHRGNSAIRSWTLSTDSFLEFPLVDSKDPHKIYFALREETCLYGKTNLVAVNMLSNKLASLTPYTFGSFEDCEGDDMDKFTASCNLCYNEPFLPCEFSKYLDLDVPDTKS
ncbi:hypothetical protein EJB05_12277, partial [Eragrostis curvula]